MLKVKQLLKSNITILRNPSNNNPLVSIIMPTYCRGDNGLLCRAIDSVLCQTFKDFELIIVDDGSIDKTQTLVNSYLKRDSRIVYIRNEFNSGLPAMRVNQGIEQSSGKYICYQFDDDQWEPDALDALVKKIEEYPYPVVVYGAWQVENNVTKEKFVHRHEFRYDSLVECNFIANNSVIHPRSLCESLGMYDMHLAMRRLCDWDLWLRYGKEVPFIYLDRVISKVVMMSDGSLGETVSYDLETSRMFFNNSRNCKLCINAYKEYDIDDLSLFLNRELKNSIYNLHILPWKIKNKEFYTEETNTLYNIPPVKKRIIVTKFDYDATVTILVENFLNICTDLYDYIYIPEKQLDVTLFLPGDILILCRASQLETLNIVKELKASVKNIPILYFIDDNLLNIHTLGEEFSYLRPGTEMFKTISELIRLSDRVVSFSDAISKDIRHYNTKISRLNVSIKSCYLKSPNFYYEGERFKIIFAGGGARKEEFDSISNDLLKLAEVFKEKIEFTFWGFIPEKLKTLDSSMLKFMPYTTSYTEYLHRLSKENFNLLICPLDNNDFKCCKSPVKLMEMCCCGAVGLYSDMPVYDCVEDGKNGYKIKEGESWFQKITQIIEQPIEEKVTIFNNALITTKQLFSVENQLESFKNIVKTAEVESKLSGRKVLYICHSAYLAGAENHLLRHAILAQKAGLNIMFGLPDAFRYKNEILQQRLNAKSIDIIYLPFKNYCEVEEIVDEKAANEQVGKQLFNILTEENIGLIHTCTLIPSAAYAAKLLNIPCISSIYATTSHVKASKEIQHLLPDFVHSDSVMYANLWQQKLGCLSRTIRSYIPSVFYRTNSISPKSTYRIALSGSLQERKGQLETIKAIGLLKKSYNIELYMFGYTHFYPEYKKKCDQAIQEYGLSSKVHFMGVTDTMAEDYQRLEIDMLICASTFESFPQVVLEAMAMEIPVICTPAGGIPELIKNSSTGFLTTGYSESCLAISIKNCITSIEDGSISTIISSAKAALLKECSKNNVTYQLLDIYSNCLSKITSVSATLSTTEILSKLSPANVPIGPTINPNDVMLSSLINKHREFYVDCTGRNIKYLGIIPSTFSGKLKGKIQITIVISGLVKRTIEKNLEDLKLEHWNYFEFDPIFEYSGPALIQINVYYEKDSSKLGVYENRIHRSLLYKISNKLNLQIKGKDVLLCSFK